MLGRFLRGKQKTLVETAKPAPTFSVFVTAKPHQIIIDFAYSGRVEELRWEWTKEGMAEIPSSELWPAYFVYGGRLFARFEGIRVDISELERHDQSHEMRWLLGDRLWDECNTQLAQARAQPYDPDKQYPSVEVQLSHHEWLGIESACMRLWQEWRQSEPYRVVLYSRGSHGSTLEEKSRSCLDRDGTNYWQRQYVEEANRRKSEDEKTVARHGSHLYPELPRKYWVVIE
ncbi:MAG: hypothetical protein ACREGB_01620 [Candidatus Saccharimonadales bacterium]